MFSSDPRPSAVHLFRVPWRRKCAADIVFGCQNPAAYQLSVQFGAVSFRLPVCAEHAELMSQKEEERPPA